MKNFFSANKNNTRVKLIGRDTVENAIGSTTNTANPPNLIKFTFETTNYKRSHLQHISQSEIRVENGMRMVARTLDTPLSRFKMTFYFDSIDAPEIRQTRARTQELVEHCESYKVVARYHRETVIYNHTMMGLPLSVYLGKYAHVENVSKFLEVYETALTPYSRETSLPLEDLSLKMPSFHRQ